MTIQEYVKELDLQFQTGNAREHSYRPALQQLLASMLPQHVVTNEPAHIECGAPDYIITQRKGAKQPVFFVEAKDLFDNDLDGIRQHREQFTRYKESLDYIIFTDYLDFHVYEHGEWTMNVRIAEQQGTHLRLIKTAESDFEAMISHLADSKPLPITSPARLAKLMASKARLLADVIKAAFDNASDKTSEHYYNNDQLQGELDAFRSVLISDLTPSKFADIYAQTIAYGMFAARLHDDTPNDFSRMEAATLIPKTNPFLRQIFQTIAGFDLDERIAWIVDDLAQTFLATDIDRVMRVYAKNALHKDTMIHFYEDFLAEYDPKERKKMGVWYTPQPVVSFIVRAVDEILQKDFDLPEGLADSTKIEKSVKNPFWDGKDESKKMNKVGVAHRVQILDPATGTGTFLAEVVRQIYSRFSGMQGAWQNYVEEHLLKRLNGFEILMASYAVAHLKLDLLLRDTGYDSSKNNNERLRVYLTNSLEECHQETHSLFATWLANEAKEANNIKTECPVMVMIGNPPYSGESQNKGAWIMNLMEDYKKEPGGKTRLKERNPKWINDDYVKFIRLAQDYVERNGIGIIGFINPHGYLDNPTFRGMRWNLLKTFDKIYTIDLHGNSKKKETCPDGSKDDNVFDIMQGVSINLFVKTGEKAKNELGKVYHKDLYGHRKDKYEFLSNNTLSTVGYEEIKPQVPMYFFVPKELGLMNEYEKGICVNDTFEANSVGVVTAHDKILIDENPDNLIKKVSAEYNEQASMHKVLTDAYRPFDNRYVYYDTSKIERAREKVMCHFFKENIGLMTCRQAISNDWKLVSITDKLVDDCYVSNKTKERGYVFPLYLYSTSDNGQEEKHPNLNKKEWAKFDKAVGRKTSPEELLQYIYGVLHSPSYRERFKEFLKIDFPRIPLPESEAEFNRKAECGRKLIDLHLMRNTQSWQTTTTFPEAGKGMVDAISYKDGRVMINQTQYFGNVPEVAWNAYIGGYQPAQKWLKDRKGRTLSYEDIRHYTYIIHALNEMQKIMLEIDL